MDTLPFSSSRRTTQAAEGLPRWRWTTADLVRLTELGAFTDQDHFELIGGEIVPMSPASRRHEIIADALAKHWQRLNDPTVYVVREPQLNLTEDTYTKPDILICPDAIKTPDVRGPETLLVVEVAHTSLRKDTAYKATFYATYRVPEYWIIDADDLSVRRHCIPRDGHYTAVSDWPATDVIVPEQRPNLAVRLADLDVT